MQFSSQFPIKSSVPNRQTACHTSLVYTSKDANRRISVLPIENILTLLCIKSSIVISFCLGPVHILENKLMCDIVFLVGSCEDISFACLSLKTGRGIFVVS